MELVPYTPSLYRPDSIGRYRSYGRTTRTPIPGAGYPNRRMMWGEQELNLHGSARRQRYGVGPVPLRGCDDGLMGCDGLGALFPGYARNDGHVKMPSMSMLNAQRQLRQSGLGVDLTGAIDTAAALLRDPNTYLRAHGPALVTSLDTYVVSPMIGAVARKSVPYLLKYVAPPLAILYLLSGLAVYYSHAAASRKSGGSVTANKRRRRRKR